MMSSDGCSTRQSMYSEKMAPLKTADSSGPCSSERFLPEVVAHRFLVGFRDSEEHPDDPHRHLRAEVADEIEAAGTDERIQQLHAELTDRGLE